MFRPPGLLLTSFPVGAIDCFWSSQSASDLKEPNPEMSHQEMTFLGMITALLLGIWLIIELFSELDCLRSILLQDLSSTGC